MFDERHFPYEYECEGCPKTATVTHEDVPSYLVTSGVAEAVEYVMINRRRWSLESMHGPFCPACADRMY
jgi:hypothetical protein